jgi:flagellar biosynthesis protein FlhG
MKGYRVSHRTQRKPSARQSSAAVWQRTQRNPTVISEDKGMAERKGYTRLPAPATCAWVPPGQLFTKCPRTTPGTASVNGIETLKIRQDPDDGPQAIMKTPGKDDSAKRVITVGGGKGGVGKSIVASNLALAIAHTGARVVLVDCDLGAANQHVLFGIDRPKPGIQGLLDRKIDSLDEGLTPTPHPNLHLVAGTGASVGAANINHGEKQRIIRRIRALTADVILIDVGAGVSYNVLDFFEQGAQRLLVVTPQVTSIQTAYSFLKGAVMRTLQHHAEKSAELELLAPAAKSGENEKVSQILARVRDQSPALAESIDKVLLKFGAQIVGNQVFEAGQTGIFHAITRMIQDFLGITVPILGTVRASRRIRESVNLRKPMMLGAKDDDTRAFQQMAEALLAEDVAIDDLLFEEAVVDPSDEARSAARATHTSKAPPRPPEVTSAAPPPTASGDAAHDGTEDAFDRTPTTAPKIRVPPPVPALPATASPAAAPPSDSAAAIAPPPARPSTSGLLDPYMRRSARVEVDWTGSLRDGAGVRPVRILEISDGGAVVQTAQSLDLGQDLTLVFEQIPAQPQTRVKVIRRSAMGFVLEGEIPPNVTAAAAPAPAPRRLAG